MMMNDDCDEYFYTTCKSSMSNFATTEIKKNQIQIILSLFLLKIIFKILKLK